MENLILSIEREMLDLQIKQNNTINIIKLIQELGNETKYYNILKEQTELLAEYDSRYEELRIKNESYKELQYDYYNYHYRIDEIPLNQEME